MYWHKVYFFFNDKATTEIYTLSLHDALPILALEPEPINGSKTISPGKEINFIIHSANFTGYDARSEEHTSELQSRRNLVCRLLLEKKKK